MTFTPSIYCPECHSFATENTDWVLIDELGEQTGHIMHMVDEGRECPACKDGQLEVVD